ncbi:MAG TPA: VOC family protein [Candidatus Binataceae bacterium]|nr:VOC family protein [Candidatus Binataceae bacterium]
MLLGSINHVSITVSDLRKAMEFFGPFLEFLGYHIGAVFQDPNGQHLTVNVNFANGDAVNVWEAKPELTSHPFQVYEVGLHHLAFNTETHEQVDQVYELVKKLGAEILDGPAEFPYGGPDGWYAVYFLGPDRMKFEVVHMPAAERRYKEMRSRYDLDAARESIARVNRKT